MAEAFELDSIEACLEDLRAGKFIVITDDESRENEGDLVMAAETVKPADVNFCIREARGLLCAPCAGEILDRLGIDLAPSVNRGDTFATAFTLSIDGARHTGVTTGISAEDRCTAIHLLVDEGVKREDIVSPGHLFPLRAREGGVLVRAGHTEATVDLARLAGFKAAGICCEITRDDGQMARLPDLIAFAKKHGLKMCSVAQLIAYRKRSESLIERVESVNLPTAFGDFRLTMFRSRLDGLEHLALTMGDLTSTDATDAPLVRVHSECLTGDVFGSARCDCGWQLQSAMKQIAKEGRGCVLYMRQEGRGIGLANKLHAYRLQEQGCDTVEANVKLGFAPDLRDYGIGAQILSALGVTRLRLLTNNPQKMVGLSGYGLEVVAREAIVADAGPYNAFYLDTKREKMGHLI
jgi:3,4-dihydroxy 2-butanone 4-phosphate synthase/GTP cyclohydrolase II